MLPLDLRPAHIRLSLEDVHERLELEPVNSPGVIAIEHPERNGELDKRRRGSRQG